ncbi:MAG TPA: TIM barrel protein [Thermomicrobiales bacterium]|jgi:inosose dehydratase|nr:TIM barrel protein [Thermomicrobiales bacterium]
MLKVATASVNWNNIDLGDDGAVSFPNILDLAREAGYTAMEYNPAFGDDPQVLLDEAGKRGIAWCGTYQSVDLVSGPLAEDVLDTIDRRAALLASIDCRDLVVAEPGRPERIAIAGQVPEDGSASLPRETYPGMAENLHAVAEVAGRHGVRIHFHNHVGTWIETPAELDALMEHMDTARVDLCFDTGHYAYGGGNALAFLRQYPETIGYVHLKDVNADVLAEAKAKRWSFLEALRHIIFSPLGHGSAEIPEVLSTLVSSRFEGWVVVEQDTCEGDSTATALQNRQYIERQVGSR